MVSQMVSHSVYILIALIAIAMILATFSVFRGNIEKVSVESSLNIVADSVKLEILRLYSSSESGKIEIPLQSRLGEKPMIIRLSNGKISVELDNYKVEKDIKINANLDGVSNLPAFLVLTTDSGVKTINLVSS